MANLSDNQIPRITELLLPKMDTADERDVWLTQAFYITERRLYNQIDRSGSALVFTTRLIKTLLDVGCIQDRHVLGLLLTAIKLGEPLAVQVEINTLISTLDTLCVNQPHKADPVTTEQPTLPLQTLETPAEQRTPTVFISYARRDSEYIRRLISDLQAAGHACWIDTTEIKGGDEWVRAITEGINNSYAFISVVTAASNESKWVRREYLWAEGKNKLILPVIASTVSLPIYMIDRHAIILHPDYQHGLATLLKELPPPTFVQVDAPSIASLNQRALELEYLDRLRLEELLNIERYTPQAAVAQVRTKQAQVRPVTIRPEFEHLRKKFAPTERETQRFEDIAGAINSIQRAVVLGEPGAGKTTTLWKIASNLMNMALDDPAAPIPLVIRLSKWTKSDQSLFDFVRVELASLGGFLDKLLSEKRAALLLDGLNEIPTTQREDKARQIKTLLDSYPDVMVVVSCREQDYTLDLGIDRIAITLLDPLRIREFVTRYLNSDKGDELFWRLVGEDLRSTYFVFKTHFGERLEDWETVFWLNNELPDDVKWGFNNAQWKKWCSQRDDPNSLLTLARNPYMLLMLTEVYTQTGELPRNRGQLFGGFVETLLRREDITAKQADDLLYNLRTLAYMMQFRRMGEAVGGMTAVTNQEGSVEQIIKMAKDSTEKADAVDAVTSVPREAVTLMFGGDEILYAASSASLLTVNEDSVRFSHQLLQEYFLAQYLRDTFQQTNASKIWPPDVWWRRNNWEQATILLAGLFSENCTPVLDWVASANPEVAAQCILHSGAYTPPETLEKFRTIWLPRLTDVKNDPEPQARAAVGRALGLLGLDNRPGVGLRQDSLPDIAWCEIPEGTFTYQQSQVVTLPRYFIAKYPVTYSQYQRFLDESDGFTNDVWFDGLAKRPNDSGDQAFKYSNHPRDRVNYFDAMGFCRWLSSKLGYEVRLPTEQEWEKAARGSDKRQFAFGNTFDESYANTRELDLGGTTAVGIFPQSASPYGVLDMTGNVFEWTLAELGIGVAGTSANKHWTLRGGSWFRDKDVAMTTSRTSLSMNDRYSSVGFRVVALNPGK